MAEFRLLGAVAVHSESGPLDTGQPRQRAVLAILLVEAGRLVTWDTLIDRVWDQHPPPTARQSLYSYATHIRALLRRAGSPAALHRQPGGYVLTVDPELVDLHRFRRLVMEARLPGLTTARRAELLREALALWEGEPLTGISGDWFDNVRVAWRQERLDAVILWARAELDTGEGASAVTLIVGGLIGDYPLVEPLAEVLMRALVHTGQTSAALNVFHDIRQRLHLDLGLDPGTDLRKLHTAILRGELAGPVSHGMPATQAVPKQLPAPPRHFVGRAAEFEELTYLLGETTTPHGTVILSAIGGTAGIGKTALAVYWAHQVADRFPDGQLYVNLRGFDPSGSVMDPAAAVRRFLDALQVPPERVPVELDAQAALYRSLVSGRRMLVVLDNARDTAQVRPLLPGAPGCLVLVTSRNQLSGLVAMDGAHPITLDLLTEAEAQELLSRRLGADRTAAEPQAVQEIIIRCARLPLALAIVAARAATHPQFRLRTLAAELRHAGERLDVLTGDDPYSDVRTVFSWSYHALSREAARMFRLLGLHPGPDLSAPAAASLAGLPLSQVRPLLAELVRMNLIVEHIPGRYVMHDLLQVYATDLTETTDLDSQRHAATRRMLDHYLHTAHTADRLLDPKRDPISLSPPQPGTTPEHPTNHDQALTWCTAEHTVLLATVEHAAATGFDTHTWQLAWSLTIYLLRRGHWHDWVATGRAAVAAAHRLADPTTQARAHDYLATAYTQLGRFEDAHTQLRHALDLTAQVGDLSGQAHALHTLAQVLGGRGRHAEALEHARQALDLFRTTDHQLGQGRTLNVVGWYHAQLGEHQQALTYCQQSLTLLQELDDRDGQAATWDSIGYAQHHLGHHTHAITSYQHALHLRRDLGHRYLEADTLTRLGETHHATGNPHAARDAWQHALTILNDLGHPDVEQVRAKLAALDTQP